jgi:hypothetical protein
MAAAKKPASKTKMTKNKGGRPTKYKTEYAKQAEKLCKLGATDAELATFFDVSEVTLNAWKGKHPEFLKSLRVAKAEADARVERSLYQRAVGYSHPDVHISSYEGKITLTPITKHYPPDATSMIFWLKNRKSDEWRDKHEHIGDIKITRIESVIVDPADTDS